MLRSLLLRASRNPMLESRARKSRAVRRAVRRFLPGETLSEALDACGELARRGIPGVLTQLGENVVSPEEADGALSAYLGAVEGIRKRRLDVHLSVKPTHLGLDLGMEETGRRLLGLEAAAAQAGIPLWLDMEDAGYVDRTLSLYRALLDEGSGRVGVCLQAYLHRTPWDLEELLAQGGRIRLVKGAYRESREVALQDPAGVDGAFLALAERLRREVVPPGGVRHALGTHDLALLHRLGLDGDGPAPSTGPLEVQMLYGIQEGGWEGLVERGVPFRVLVSHGARWYPWFTRRLAERPANLRFLLRR